MDTTPRGIVPEKPRRPHVPDFSAVELAAIAIWTAALMLALWPSR